MKNGEGSAQDVDVDLGHLFASLKRHWVRILVVALAVTAVVTMLALMATPRYRAETRLIIEVRESVYTRPQASEAGESAPIDSETVASQVEVIGSTETLTQVARELDLASREEFDESPSAIGRMLIAFGLKRDVTAIPPEERVLEAFREKLQVYRIEDSRVIVIRFTSEDPVLSARVPDAVAEAYITGQREAKLASTEDATQWLEPEIADLRDRVREAEARVAEYRAQSDLLIGQNNTVLATQQLSELSSELSRVRAARAAAESKAEAVRAAIERGAAPETLPDVLESTLIQRLRERQVELRSQIADLSSSLLSNHPRIRALQSQLADLDAQIAAEARKVLEALETEAETARLRERDLLAELNMLKAESARADEEQVELRALEREATAQRELLETYLARFREAAARSDRSYLPVDARVFSPAVVPSEPYFPKVVPIALAAFAGSLLLMAIVVLLRELFSGRALRPSHAAEVEPVAQLHMPAAGPARSYARAPLEASEPDGLSVEAAAEALISTGVTRAIFVSPEGDQAAAAAVLVAREVADTGLRVLLVDLTATGAATRPMLESDSYPGITNLLASEAPLSDIIHADLYSACHIIPIGTSSPDRAMRGIDRLSIIMESLTTAYDLVVVECGAVGAGELQRLMDEDAQLLVSIVGADEDRVALTAEELMEEGFGAPLLVMPAGPVDPPEPRGRDAA